jgi:cation diffusion facilitator family transporter
VHEGSKKAILAAFVANLGIAIAKFIAFALTGAASMLAEAVHSVADTGNQSLLFLGGRRAQRAESKLHPFGYGRERYFWSFVVALVLFSLGAVFATYEGVEKLIHPHELEDPAIAFAVLGIAICLEVFSFRTAIREANLVRGRRGWWEFIRTSRSPELPVVLLEDLGALVGLCFALAGVSLTVITGDEVFDACGSIAIGLLLGVIAIVLAIEMKSLLIGEAAVPEDEDAILRVLDDSPAVARVIHLRTLHLGPDELLVAVKFEPVDGSLEGVGPTIDELESRIRAVVPSARRSYLEPDQYRPSERDDRSPVDLPPRDLEDADAADHQG